jgi:hypothetical protein
MNPPAPQLEWMAAAGFKLVDTTPRDHAALYQGHKLHPVLPLDAVNPAVLMAVIIDTAQQAATEDLRLRARKLAADLGLALKPQ